jgi:CheY-like chemotaxis protein
MGGDIEVRSHPGDGSIFSFELDLIVAQPMLPVAPERGYPDGYEGPRKKVLVIDDVAQNRAMLFQSLNSLGFEVFNAVDGSDGLEVAARVGPDLIVTDAMMPVMDGVEATRRLRQLPGLAAVPIIATSASVTREVEARCREAGADAFVPKPIDHHVLLQTVGALMRLTWTYEESAPRPAERAMERELVYPAPAEMHKLRKLARTGHMPTLREYAEHLRSLDARYAPFATRLAALARAYQTRAIMALLDGP